MLFLKSLPQDLIRLTIMPSRIKAKIDPSQKSMLSFFAKTTMTKFEPKDINEKTDMSEKGPSTKKAKLSDSRSESVERTDDGGDSSASEATPLTPEQKKIIHGKAMQAKLLKQAHLLKVLDPEMGTTWFSALENEFKKEYFKELSDFVTSVRNRATVYPPQNNVWEWTKQCLIRDVKVVILGQDPYHGPNQAHGLCFSVKKGVPPPPSLVNMYKELESDIQGFKIPTHGCLTGWAEQGVLLLNAVLTVEAGKANSHKDQGWEKLTDAVISWISTNLDSVVFLLWGAYAQKKAAVVDKKKHHLLSSPHPSPLSAHRGFLGCKHFSKCNDLLKKNGKVPIDWSRLP